MAFTLPDFNLSVDFYANANPPPAHPPLFRSVCAWVQPRRFSAVASNAAPPSQGSTYQYLLLPTGISVGCSLDRNSYYLARVVGMAGCVFYCLEQVIVGAGHSNEHLQLAVSKYGPWPDLLPSPTPN